MACKMVGELKLCSLCVYEVSIMFFSTLPRLDRLIVVVLLKYNELHKGKLDEL